MMEEYIKILKESGADAWEITDLKTKGWEFYFIGHRLDQNRAKDVEHITFKVYKYSDDRQYMGIASAEISPTETLENVCKTVKDLVSQANLVKNRPYKLNQPLPASKISTEDYSLENEAEKYIRAFDDIAESENEYLNSYEIFVEQHERRLITSEGIDITEEYPSSTLDIVVNARNENSEIELYRLYSLGLCDEKQVKQDVEELLKFGKDRLLAVPTPDLKKTAIVLSTDAALEVYRFFLDNLNAAFIVRGMSRFEIGKPVAENIKGDQLTLKATRVLPGSPCNFAYDEEGAPVKDCFLVKDGIVLKYVGNRMFSQYLGLKDSFNVSNWVVSGGSRSEEEIRSGSFLEIVEFSDFQVDGMTGDIFGEIRLAYYHDENGTVTPVSGGSVSGSMLDNLGEMYMSSETRRYSNAEIPRLTRLENITLAGAE